MTKCKARVWDDRGCGSHLCFNNAVTSAGFCRVHDPDCQAERRKKRPPTQFEQQMALMEIREKRAKLIDAVVKAARVVVKNGGIKTIDKLRKALDELGVATS